MTLCVSMKLCSMTGGRLGRWRRSQRDNQPFAQRQILPIAGFRGNRVMYGESWWEPERDEEEGNYRPRALEPEEPVYSEPGPPIPGMVTPILSSPDSGYLSLRGTGRRLSCSSSDTDTSLLSGPGELSPDVLTGTIQPRSHETCHWGKGRRHIHNWCEALGGE